MIQSVRNGRWTRFQLSFICCCSSGKIISMANKDKRALQCWKMEMLKLHTEGLSYQNISQKQKIPFSTIGSCILKWGRWVALTTFVNQVNHGKLRSRTAWKPGRKVKEAVVAIIFKNWLNKLVFFTINYEFTSLFNVTHKMSSCRQTHIFSCLNMHIQAISRHVIQCVTRIIRQYAREAAGGPWLAYQPAHFVPHSWGAITSFGIPRPLWRKANV